MNENAKEEQEIRPRFDPRLLDFVDKLRSIPLGHSEAEGDSSQSQKTTRDRLIYDCGYAAGVVSAAQSQASQRQRYRLLFAAATVVIGLLGAYAWQIRGDTPPVARDLQSSQLKNSVGEDVPISRSPSAKELAAEWVAVQNRLNKSRSQPPQLTPSSQSIDTVGNNPSPTVLPTDPVSNPSLLRSNSFTHALEWDV